MSVKNKTVVFTGFRDAALQKKVEDQGGRVTSAVSGKTDVLVVSGSKGVDSAKAAKARALGVRVVTREDFEKGFLSLFDRIFFKQSEYFLEKTGQTCFPNLDNGGQTFLSCFNSRRFWVTRGPVPFREGDVVVPPTAHSRVFVGKSPENKMTKFSSGYGPRFDGNSMLFELPQPAAKRKYVFVGASVFSFAAAAPIERFLSPFGNSGVPYPYAVDRDGGVYFLEYHAVTLMTRPTQEIALAVEREEDPYRAFYDLCKKHGYRTDAGDWYDRRNSKQKYKAAPSRAEYIKKIRQIGKTIGVSEVKIRVIAPRDD